MSPERTIHIDRAAMPNYAGHGEIAMLWPGEIDDLIRFLYANQTVIFAEDAVLFDFNGELIIKRDPGLRIQASWEVETENQTLPPPPQGIPIILTEEQIAALDSMIENDAERMYAQQRATHDYTINDLRRAMDLRDSLRHALHPQRPQ